MHHPLLSIIIPTYNSENKVNICLDSILSQSFKNFEVLIIDGASTDNTINVIKKYATINPLIKIFSEKDKGIYDAMNKGIRLARGEWIYFLGSDDCFYSELILEKIFAHSDFGYDVIYGNVVSPRFNGLYDGVFSEEKLFNKNICHQAVFFQRDIFKITGHFNLKYKALADWDHNLKWFCCKRINKKYINETIAYYADGGYSSQNSDNIFLNDKRWRLIKYNKKSTTFLNKLRTVKLEIKNAFKENRKGDAMKILIETPFLLF